MRRDLFVKFGFGLLRDPSFLPPRMRIPLCISVFEYFSTCPKLIHFAKNEETGRTRGAPKKRVPEEGEIGCSSMPLTF